LTQKKLPRGAQDGDYNLKLSPLSVSVFPLLCAILFIFGVSIVSDL
jgi:hypothetical protein